MNAITRPHHIAPSKATCRIVQAVKNFAAIKGVCHIGLGVTATNNAKVLRRDGWYAESWSTQTATDLRRQLEASEMDAQHTGKVPVSHVIVSAPSWVQPDDFKALVLDYPNIEFVMLNHSGAAFLCIDKFGIRNNRVLLDLALSVHNFRVAANNTRVQFSLENMFGGAPVLLLPNMYDVESFQSYPAIKPIGHTLRVGSFGAGRPWKNQLSAAQGAVIMARQLGVQLELYVNTKRPDGGERIIESREEIFQGLRGTKVIEVPWESWPRFRHTISTLNIMVQPSFDETFNVVTADGIAAGVATVTASSIEWTPRDWWAECEDPMDIARTGIYLLHHSKAIEEARAALRQYAFHGLLHWRKYLGGTINN